MFSALLVSQNAGRRQNLTSVALTTNQLMLARILEEYPSGIALTRLLHVVEPEIVLLDLAGGDAALAFAHAIRAANPALPVLGFSDTPAPVHAGGPLDIVLTYPPTSEELSRFVGALVRRTVFRAKENLLLFLPAKAGSGASTIVWNTAAALAEQGARRVLAIEADYRSGALSLQFNESPEGSFRYPVGEAGLKGQGYETEIVRFLPREVAASYCGVGNPFSLGDIAPGESVLDVGCGCGVDVLVAATKVGPGGRVVGIDLVAEMLCRARENLRTAGLDNVVFRKASAQRLPLHASSFDVVISNGAFNLVADKEKALGEVFRVLKPGGRFMIADQVLTVEPGDEAESRIDNWAG